MKVPRARRSILVCAAVCKIGRRSRDRYVFEPRQAGQALGAGDGPRDKLSRD
jgi:hypothetical protein